MSPGKGPTFLFGRCTFFDWPLIHFLPIRLNSSFPCPTSRAELLTNKPWRLARWGTTIQQCDTLTEYNVLSGKFPANSRMAFVIATIQCDKRTLCAQSQSSPAD